MAAPGCVELDQHVPVVSNEAGEVCGCEDRDVLLVDDRRVQIRRLLLLAGRVEVLQIRVGSVAVLVVAVFVAGAEVLVLAVVKEAEIVVVAVIVAACGGGGGGGGGGGFSGGDRRRRRPT